MAHILELNAKPRIVTNQYYTVFSLQKMNDEGNQSQSRRSEVTGIVIHDMKRTNRKRKTCKIYTENTQMIDKVFLLLMMLSG